MPSPPTVSAGGIFGGGRSLTDLRTYEPKDYTAPAYVATNQVEGMHRWPRFSWTNQITDVFQEDTRNEYIKGVAIGSIITLFVFIVWALVLVLLKCAGKRVGCASGRPRKPKEPKIAGSITEESYQKTMKSWKAAVRKYERRLLISRIIFLLAGVGVIVSAVLFFVLGVGSLINSLGDVQSSIVETEDILQQLHDLTGDFIDMSVQADADREVFVETTDTVCNGVVDAAVDNFVSEDVQQQIASVISTVESIDDSLRESLTDLQGDLAEAITMTEDINSGLDQAYPFLYATAAVMGVAVILALCLMIEVIMAWRGRKMRNCFVSCMKNAVILPIFFLFILLSWLFASLFQLVAIGGSDFCVKPDATIEFVLKKYVEDRMSPVLFAYLTYYLRCQTDVNPTEIIAEAAPLWDGIGAVHTFIEYAESNADAVNSVCSGSGQTIQSLASVLHSSLHAFNGLLVVALNLLDCATFNPIYVSALHEGLCANGASGLAWLFSTLLCMGIFSMIMITLRAARSETEGGARYVEDVDGGYEPYRPEKMAQNEEEHDLALRQDSTVPESGPPVIEPDTSY